MSECTNSENLWTQLLSLQASKSSNKTESKRSLLVLGENYTGKTSLVSKLKNDSLVSNENVKQIGMQYTFLGIKDAEIEDERVLSMNITDGDIFHSDLIRFELNEQSFGQTVCVLISSLSQPWRILDDLEMWVGVLTKYADKVKMPESARQRFKDDLVLQFQQYIEKEAETTGSTEVPPDESTNNGSAAAPPPAASSCVISCATKSTPDGRRKSTILTRTPSKLRNPSTTVSQRNASISEEAEVDEAVTNGDDSAPPKIKLEPLDEGVFDINCGIPIVVVINQSDSHSTLERDFGYKEEHFEFIQSHLRRFCLKYGASLFYVSAKEDWNCDLLRDYLLYRLYDFPFNAPVNVVNKETIFVPSGWDNTKKIEILTDTLPEKMRTAAYNSVINRPLWATRAVLSPRINEENIEVSDEQIFLQQLRMILGESNKGQQDRTDSSPTSGQSPSRMKKMPTSQMSIAAASSSGVNASTNLDPNSGDKTVLANFFNSLIQKKTPSTPKSDVDSASPKLNESSDSPVKLSKTTEKDSVDVAADGKVNGTLEQTQGENSKNTTSTTPSTEAVDS